MTQELFEKLEPFSGHLYTAAYCQFIRLTNNADKAVLEELYKAEFGESGNILGGCSRCVLNALKRLGINYFKYKKEQEALLQKKEKEEEEQKKKEITKTVAKNAKPKTTGKKKAEKK